MEPAERRPMQHSDARKTPPYPSRGASALVALALALIALAAAV